MLPTITITIEDDPDAIGVDEFEQHFAPWKRVTWLANIGDTKYGEVLRVPQPNTDPVPEGTSAEIASTIRAATPPSSAAFIEDGAIRQAVSTVTMRALQCMRAAIAEHAESDTRAPAS